MRLNLGGNRDRDSDRLPSLDWRSRLAAWQIFDYARSETINVETFAVIIDVPGLRQGWARYAPGVGFDAQWDNGAAPRPGREWQRGFAVRVYSHELGAREIRSTSVGLGNAICEIYDTYSTAPENKRGLLPVVQPGAPKPVTARDGSTFYDPRLEIIDWAKRPPELPITPPSTGGGGTTSRTHDELDDDIPF